MASRRDGARSSSLRTLLLIALGILFFLFLSASGTAELYTDYLWFDALDRTSVWQTVLGTQLTLAFAFFVLFFFILWANLVVADRLAPPVRPQSPEEDLIERYHQVVGEHTAKIRLGVAGLFALIAGGNTAGQWRTWLLFRNGGDFGQVDPLFNRDAGFYVFRLPFWTFLVDWFFSALVFALIVSLIAHYLNGGIRASVASNRVSGGVKLHLSGLLAVLALLRAVAYWLDRYELVTSRRGVFDGALTTDVEVQLPALNLLTLISLVGAGLFVVNIRRRGWALPVVAVGIWLISHVVAGSVFPALFQRLRVEPVQTEREQQYIGDNIAATRFAFGLDESRLQTVDFDYTEGFTAEDLAADADVFDDVMVLDPELAVDAFNRTESGRASYLFSRPDIDRYMIDGELEPVAVSVRSLNLSALDAGWEREHIVLTHGYGVAMADGTNIVREPDYLIQGIGPEQRIDGRLGLEIDQPRIYYDEGFSGYAIVGASRDEDDILANSSRNFRYDGEGGVGIGSFLRRAAFALRFSELDPLISSSIQSESRVIYNRDINLRVRELAPFLQFDSDPYPVVADGRIHWIIDAYTTTDRFPYAQLAETSSFVPGDDLRSGYNYVRNSVKVVVDAYDGDVQFYVVDEQDPIINAYRDAFPGLFEAGEAPPQFSSHFRYPTDLFKAQTDMWDTYQVDIPEEFLVGALAWRVAVQPQAAGGNTDQTTDRPMSPQYRTTRLPGEDTTDFIIQRAFVPSSSAQSGRPEVTAIMVGRSDGRLIQFGLEASGEGAEGETAANPADDLLAPDFADSNVREVEEIAQDLTLLNNQGSTVTFGEMQMVLTDDTVVYVRPLYIEADTDAAVPELASVIAVNGDRVARRTTLDAALRALASGAAPVINDGTADPDPDRPVSTPGESELDSLNALELIDLIERLYADADRVQDDDPDVAAELRAEAAEAFEAFRRLFGVPESNPPTESSGA